MIQVDNCSRLGENQIFNQRSRIEGECITLPVVILKRERQSLRDLKVGIKEFANLSFSFLWHQRQLSFDTC